MSIIEGIILEVCQNNVACLNFRSTSFLEFFKQQQISIPLYAWYNGVTSIKDSTKLHI